MNINSTIPPPSTPAVNADGYFAPEWWQYLLTLLNRTGGSGIKPDASTAAEWAAASALANTNTGAISAEQALRALAGIEMMPSMPLDNAMRARMDDIEAQDQPRADGSILARISALEDAEKTTSAFDGIQRRIDDMEGASLDMRFPVPPAPFVLPTEEDWNAPAFSGTWSNFGGGYNPAGYFKDPWGVVHLRGLVKSTIMSTIIFNLPAGYRPAFTEKLPTSSNNAFGIIEITNTGDVDSIVGVNLSVCLDGITFKAA